MFVFTSWGRLLKKDKFLFARLPQQITLLICWQRLSPGSSSNTVWTWSIVCSFEKALGRRCCSFGRSVHTCRSKWSLGCGFATENFRQSGELLIFVSYSHQCITGRSVIQFGRPIRRGTLQNLATPILPVDRSLVNGRPDVLTTDPHRTCIFPD